MSTHIPFRAVGERRVLDNFGLDATLIGAVDTSVLLWDLAAFINNGAVRGATPAGTIPPVDGLTPIWATELNAANPAPGTGTTVKLRRRGQYIVTFSIDVLAQIVAGISLDAPAPTLLAANAPLNTQAGIVQGMQGGGATLQPITLSCEVTISDTMAGSATRGIVRFHAALPSEGGPITTSEVGTGATARYTIAYAGDVMGS